MILRQPNWVLFAVLLMLLGMTLMTIARLVMDSSRTLYVLLMTGTAISMIGSAFCLARKK